MPHGRPGGRGWLQALQEGLPPESSWSAAACRRVSCQGRARTRSLLLPGTRRGARARAAVSYELSISVKALRRLRGLGLVVGKACMHACRAQATMDGHGTAQHALDSIVSSSLARSIGSHVREYGRSACDTYEISRRQPRGLTTLEPGGKVFCWKLASLLCVAKNTCMYI